MADKTVTPLNGGMLLSALAPQRAGFANYVEKLDWRRIDDQEMRREGHDYFRPNLSVPVGNQPYPNQLAGEPVTLLCEARRENGQRAVVAGTPTKLFRFYPSEEGEYYLEFEPADYYEEPSLGVNIVPGGATYAGGSGEYILTVTPGQIYKWTPLGPDDKYIRVNGVVYWTEIFFVSTIDTVELGSASLGGQPVLAAVQTASDYPYFEVVTGSLKAPVLTGSETLDRTQLYETAGGLRFFNQAVSTGNHLVTMVHDGTLVGDTATATWNGLTLAIKINFGTTTLQTVETAIRSGAAAFLAFWQVQGSDYYGASNAGYYESSGVGAPYYGQETGSWALIGSGFSSLGKRWQAKNLNGYLILNNAYDLPVTFRVEENAVVPIYEMREQGVAFVGEIEVENDILLCADIASIELDALDTLFAHTTSGAITASQAGALSSGAVTATDDGGGDIVASGTGWNGGTGFTAGMVGRTIEFQNGWRTTIAAFIDATHVTLTDDPATMVGAQNLIFYVINLATDYVVTASGGIFTAAMVGRQIFWGNGARRTITAFTSATSVTVDQFLAVPAGAFTIENVTSYAAYHDAATTSRVQYRFIDGMISEPRRWAAVWQGSIDVGTTQLRLTYPVKGLEVGMQVTIVGAGILGANLTARVVSVSYSGLIAQLSTSAGTTVTNVFFQATDSIGSGAGNFQDLPSETGAILRMLDLDGTLVIYKEGSIIPARYTGVATARWDFGVEIRTQYGVRYRDTLVHIQTARESMHVWAGADRFYKFNLTTRQPEVLQALDVCRDKFFGAVKSLTANQLQFVFGAINVLTKEAVFWFPGPGADQALCWDYIQNTCSTTAAAATAACSLKRPTIGIATEASDDWFILGTVDGVVLRYGRSNVNEAAWGGTQDMYHRLGAGYQSVLRSGLWGDNLGEVLLSEYIAHLAAVLGGPLTVNLYGRENASQAGTLLCSQTFVDPDVENLLPTYFSKHWLQDEVVLSGANNPCRLAARTANVRPVRSRSTARQHVE